MSERIKLAALEQRVLRTSRKYGMLPRGTHLVVAVSGGADSMALLLCLHDLAPVLDLRLTVAHLHHGLRGQAADRDEDFVRRASADHGWPFVAEHIDIKALAGAERKNLEETAREARYEFLKRAAVELGASRIATGHNLNDQAETILFRLLRGSGPGGLAGIQPVLESLIVRPLIECSRSQILEFLCRRKALFCDDATNRDLNLHRNRIRHELIPYLEEHFNPRLAEALARNAELAHAAHEFLQEHAAGAWGRMRIPIPDGVALPVSVLVAMHPALRQQVVRLALHELLGSLRGIESVHIKSILRLCARAQSGRQIDLPGGVLAKRSLDRCELFQRTALPAEDYAYPLIWPGTCLVPKAGFELTATVQPFPKTVIDKASCALLNAEVLPPELIIRTRRFGDRYGGPGHRKIKRMLLDARIPEAARKVLPLISAGGAVIWIPGFLPAKTYRAAKNSSRCVRLDLRPIGTARKL